jgi:hypothetical protein
MLNHVVLDHLAIIIRASGVVKSECKVKSRLACLASLYIAVDQSSALLRSIYGFLRPGFECKPCLPFGAPATGVSRR